MQTTPSDTVSTPPLVSGDASSLDTSKPGVRTMALETASCLGQTATVEVSSSPLVVMETQVRV